MKTHDERLDVLPGLGLSSIREEVHDDSTTVDSLIDGEESLSGNLQSFEKGPKVSFLVLNDCIEEEFERD